MVEMVGLCREGLVGEGGTVEGETEKWDWRGRGMVKKVGL